MPTLDLASAPRHATRGPLRHTVGECYFRDRDGNGVYLTGSHTWSNIQDCLSSDPSVAFDYDSYLDWMVSLNHTFMRGWNWEQASIDQFSTDRCVIRPLPFARTGPGLAIDGLPKFDCTVFNAEYFDRLRRRVQEAGRRGVYVSVMLFEGWSTEVRRPNLAVNNPWDGHPFNGANNINGIDGDPGGSGRAIHTLEHPEVTGLQEAYVRRVIDAVNDLDNVLYEIGNEHFEDSFPWQEHMVRLIHGYEATKPAQHPVGMTSGGGGDDSVTNDQLWSSSADFIAPRERNEAAALYCTDPPAADGKKVVFADTDHLWGLGGTVDWVWKTLCRGLQPLLMDPYTILPGMDDEQWGQWGELSRPDHPVFQPIRKALGWSRIASSALDLATARPRGDLASTGYCLADDRGARLVYCPAEWNGPTVVQGVAGDEPIRVRWIAGESGEYVDATAAATGGELAIEAPFPGPSVLVLN